MWLLQKKMPLPFRIIGQACFLSTVLAVGKLEVRAQDPVVANGTGGSLLSNGDFALATKDPAWPDDWRRSPGISRKTEKGSPFLHFEVAEPGKTTRLFRSLSLAPEVKALQIAFRYRAENLQGGLKKGEAAGLFLHFYDAVKIEVLPAPEPILITKDVSPWTEARTRLRVPAGAATLEMQFGLFQGEAGVLDLAQIDATAISEGAVASPTVSAKGTVEIPIRREEGRTIIGFGKPSVWFIHPYVDVLGHNFSDGITTLVRQARDQGHPLAVGIATCLDSVNLQNEAHTIYVFSYKNINYPLPAQARRMIFLNTWLVNSVEWPASRAGKKDLVLLGSRMLNNNGDGLATDKDHWKQIQKTDSDLELTILDSTGYYLPIAIWRVPLLKAILEEQARDEAKTAIKLSDLINLTS